MTSSTTKLRDRPLNSEIVCGIAELEHTERGVLPHRLPAAARAQCADPQVVAAEAQPSGGRIAFRTASRVVELDVLRTRRVLIGIPDRPDGTVDLRVDGELTHRLTLTGGDVIRIDMRTGATEMIPGDVATLRFTDLPAQDKGVEIWLPHYERVELVALRTDEPIASIPATGRRRWVHHGSSISQGSNAASPSTTWPALVAANGSVELTNLGFAGSAMLDQFVARTMRDAPADLLSVAIGINIVNADVMRLRAFGPAVHGFLDTLRDGHPEAPLVVIGPLYCPIHENTPGPGAFDLDALRVGRVAFRATGDPDEVGQGRLTLTVIREALADIMSQRMATDPHLAYLDGHALYGPEDHAHHPLLDNLHPDAATHELIADRFTQFAFGTTGLFR